MTKSGGGAGAGGLPLEDSLPQLNANASASAPGPGGDEIARALQEDLQVDRARRAFSAGPTADEIAADLLKDLKPPSGSPLARPEAPEMDPERLRRVIAQQQLAIDRVWQANLDRWAAQQDHDGVQGLNDWIWGKRR